MSSEWSSLRKKQANGSKEGWAGKGRFQELGPYTLEGLEHSSLLLKNKGLLLICSTIKSSRYHCPGGFLLMGKINLPLYVSVLGSPAYSSGCGERLN